MSIHDVLTFVPAILVLAGLFIMVARQRKNEAALGARIRRELGNVESLTLPELIERVGLPDTVFNRGKVISALNPLVASGAVHQDEPEAIAMKNRLDDMRFRLGETKSA
ncbi:MAG: hypothetical protein U0174_15435 [Polyangiaceae bacterium]